MSLFFLILYFALLVLIARLFSLKINDLKDYFLAGRRMKAFPTAIALTASWFGAASSMGSMNAFHDKGLSGAWFLMIPSFISLLVITFFIAKPVSRQGCLSQPEAIEAAYGKAGRLLLACVILVAGTVLVASQMVAVGLLFQTLFGLPLLPALLCATAVVVSYVMWGGYYTVVLTDMVQVAVMFLAFGLLLGVTGFQALPMIRQGAVQLPAQFWNLFQDLPQNIFMTITFVLGWCIAPEMWQRMSATQNPALARKASWQATGLLMLLFAMMMGVGLLSAGLIGPSKAVLVDLSLHIPVRALGLFILLGFVAAITSTMDSTLNVSSLTVTRDIYQGFCRPQASQKELIWVGRLATVVMVVPAIVIALYFQNIIQILWISADIYASCMFIPVIGMLYIQQPPRHCGAWAMLGGGIGVLCSSLHQLGILPVSWPSWPYSTLIGVGLSTIGFVTAFYWPVKQKTSAA